MDKLNSRFDQVRIALVQMLVADATLIGAPLLNGTHVYVRMSSEAVQQVPSIQYYVLDHGLDEENFEPVVIRWEVWAKTLSSVLAIQKRLVWLLGYSGTLGGATVISRPLTAYDAPDTGQIGTVRRIVESSLEIVRLRATA